MFSSVCPNIYRYVRQPKFQYLRRIVGYFLNVINQINVRPSFFLARWKDAVDNARSEVTLENQKLPLNQWQVHPLLDGCQTVIID